MNIETVLSHSSSSGSDARRYSLNPLSDHRLPKKRYSKDPPGSTGSQVSIHLTPMEEAINELVPQDIPQDAPDYLSTGSTLTGPPTITYQNQPTDDDWDREHPDPDEEDNRNRLSNKSNQPSESSYPFSSPRERDDDESSSLPDLTGNEGEGSHDDASEDVLDYLNRAYNPDANLFSSDYKINEEEEEDVDEEGDSYIQSLLSPDVPNQESTRSRSSLDQVAHNTAKASSQPSTSQRPSARRSQPRIRRSGNNRDNDDDEVDSDLTPIMKSPKFVKPKTKNPPRSSKMKPPPLESPVSTKSNRSQQQQEEEGGAGGPSKSERSASGSRPTQSSSKLPTEGSDSQGSNIAVKRTNRKKSKTPPPSSTSSVHSPTSVLDDFHKSSTSNRGADQPSYLSDDSSTFTPYQFYGKPRGGESQSGRNQKDRNALLGLEDDDDDDSALSGGARARRNNPSNNRNALLDLDDSDGSAIISGGNQNRRRDNNNNNRNAVLGLDDSSNASSYGKGRRKSRIFGSREEEDKHSEMPGYDNDDNLLDQNDDEPSLGLGPFDNSSRGGIPPRPAIQSFSQIPIHPDMTPEEWQMAQEQIRFLEQELDNVATLCQELTESAQAAGQGGPPNGDDDWTKAQQQVKYLEQELEAVQELCNLLTATAKESTDAIEVLEYDKQRLQDLIKRLEKALDKANKRMDLQEKALDDFVNENESKCCNWCWNWISEPVVWFVAYLYRIDWII